MLVTPLKRNREKPGINAGDMLAFSIRGKLGASAGCGLSVCGAGFCGDTSEHGGIYQSRLTGYNQYHNANGRKRRRYYVRMRNYAPTNPRTEAQQANRQKFADGWHAWQDLTLEEKAVYNARGAKRGLRGCDIFMSKYLFSH